MNVGIFANMAKPAAASTLADLAAAARELKLRLVACDRATLPLVGKPPSCSARISPAAGVRGRHRPQCRQRPGVNPSIALNLRTRMELTRIWFCSMQ